MKRLAISPPALRARNDVLSLSSPLIMGVVNVTPDSFSDGGRFFSAEAAVRHGVALAEAGADILDVGGESTRPGATRVSADDQRARTTQVIRQLCSRVPLPISIDTTLATVAAAALDAGASIVNDISAGREDQDMLPLVAERDAAIVLMHMRGTPETMQRDLRYHDVIEEIARFLEERAEAALRAGIDSERIVVDPGIGFGKTVAHNLRILRELPRFSELGYPVLVGPSRKSFIGEVTGRSVDEREMGTAAAVAAAVLGGANIIRVHDVQRMVDVVAVSAAIDRAEMST